MCPCDYSTKPLVIHPGNFRLSYQILVDMGEKVLKVRRFIVKINGGLVLPVLNNLVVTVMIQLLEVAIETVAGFL